MAENPRQDRSRSPPIRFDSLNNTVILMHKALDEAISVTNGQLLHDVATRRIDRTMRPLIQALGQDVALFRQQEAADLVYIARLNTTVALMDNALDEAGKMQQDVARRLDQIMKPLIVSLDKDVAILKEQAVIQERTRLRHGNAYFSCESNEYGRLMKVHISKVCNKCKAVYPGGDRCARCTMDGTMDGEMDAPLASFFRGRQHHSLCLSARHCVPQAGTSGKLEAVDAMLHTCTTCEKCKVTFLNTVMRAVCHGCWTIGPPDDGPEPDNSDMSSRSIDSEIFSNNSRS